MRHIARLALGEVAAEHLGGVAADTDLDEVAREVRARDEVGVAHVLERAGEGIGDAHARQAGGDLLRALFAATARGGEAGDQRLIVVIEAEADDVHRLARERDRDLGAGEVGQLQRERGVAGATLAGELVVIGQRPQLHAIGLGAHRQCLRLERAVGHAGVAVQVGIQG